VGVRDALRGDQDKADSAPHLATSRAAYSRTCSHEIRTPLLSMMRISRILLDRRTVRFRTRQVQHVSFVHGGRPRILVASSNDQLDIAKIESRAAHRLAGLVRDGATCVTASAAFQADFAERRGLADLRAAARERGPAVLRRQELGQFSGTSCSNALISP